MIQSLRIWYRERFMRRRFAEIETQTRASTKLTPAYERRRIRELRAAQAKFASHSGGE